MLQAGGPDLVDAAIRHRVPGLFQAAAAGRLTPEQSGRLADAVFDATRDHLRGLAALERLDGVFDSAGVTWAVLKGPVLVETAYAGAPRPYADLDVLVGPGQFRTALEALEADGATLLYANWDLARRDGRAQLNLLDASTGLPIDLHWHLINRGPIRRGFRLPTDELLERRDRPDRLGHPALDVTDRLIHYALHAAHSGGHRLVWMADISRTLVNEAPDWDALIERSRRWCAGLPVATMLARTEATLGPSLPPGLLGILAGDRGRRSMVRWLTAWQPAGRLPGGGSIRNGLTRSLTGTLGATALLSAREGAEMVRRLWDRYPHWDDPDDPANMRYPAGGPAGRQRYLEEIGP